MLLSPPPPFPVTFVQGEKSVLFRSNRHAPFCEMECHLHSRKIFQCSARQNYHIHCMLTLAPRTL